MNVLIAGAGLAGPLLAQGLQRAGVDVVVYERAPADQPGQGYRIHIAPEGVQALRACLPPALYDRVRATAGRPGSGWRLLDPQLNVVHETLVAPEEAGDHLTVDRLTLRRILLTGIDVRYGAGFERYAVRGDRAEIVLTDGTRRDADLLVGADGTHSRVRAQLLPDAEVVELGHTEIYGTTPLTPAVADLVPVALDGFCAVVGPDGRTAALAAHQFRDGTGTDYVMWVVGAPTAGFPASLSTMAGPERVELAAGLVADWHPSIGALVRLGDPATAHTTTIRTAKPVGHWAPAPVTLVGDAIHPMVPQGTSAATALHDAALLHRRITERTGSLSDAVRAYETEMLDHGFAEVERALRTSPWNPAESPSPPSS
jgi:2-polyprenyl-6-methoxyphenol hydroxylase-like FAD-dependent oxidoreductase